MAIIKQHRVYRIDLQNNPKVLYLFGDNYLKRGNGGQAGEMRGEPNAYGIATKYRPGREDADYFSDHSYNTIVYEMDRQFGPVRMAILAGCTIVLPSDGLGTGLSELPARAPRVNQFLTETLEELCQIR